MRMGKPLRKSRAWKKAGWKGKPKHITSDTVVGQVSPDLISTYFAPRTLDMASESLEQYASDILEYEDALQSLNQTAEADIGVDGTITSEEELPLPPRKPFYYEQSRIDELSHVFSETSDHFFAKAGGWKISVNAAKFERNLDEKYGIFRPFITQHPEIESFLRNLQRKYARGYFSPLRSGPPPIPRTTAVILLFMMHRGKMRWEITLLAALFFLVGLQPWALVAIVALIQSLLHMRKQRAIGAMKKHIPAIDPYYYSEGDEDLSREAFNKKKEEKLLRPVGSPLDATSELIDTSKYDTIVIGYGTSTLYAAALLSRAGRKVLVLSSASDASGCITFQSGGENLQNLPFDVQTCNIPKISRQQDLLAPALATNTDYQGGVRFAKIGTEADGYAFEILSIPGVGADHADEEIPFVLKASGGLVSLMEDAALYLGDNWPGSDGVVGDSLTGQYVAACEKMNTTASVYYVSKILPEAINKLRSDTEYSNAAIRHASAFLNTVFPLNAHLRSLMAGIGMKGENLKPSLASMAAHVTNVCSAASEEGMHYPIGGPRALCHALANAVEKSGGRVVTSAPVLELLFDESINVSAPISTPKTENEPAAPCCVGVKLPNGQELRFSSDRYVKDPPNCPVVVSMDGFIQTFIRFLKDDIRTKYKVPRGIPALSERRPVVHFLFAFKGSASDLSVTGADFYRLPGAAIAQDEVNPDTGEVKCGEIGWSEEAHEENDIIGESPAILESTNERKTDDETKPRRKKKQRHGIKFETGTSWIHISFPSAKDPSFEKRHGKITTCVVTIEADDEMVMPFDTKPKIYVIKKPTAASAGERQRLSDRVKKDLFSLYPQLEGKILHGEIRGPFQKGLCHNPERYAAKGVRADTPYPGLYVGGNDVTVGDSFSGGTIGAWLVANAVCGYNALDFLFLQKNVTSDLERFLEAPVTPDEDDHLAVPYSPPVRTTENDVDVKEE